MNRIKMMHLSSLVLVITMALSISAAAYDGVDSDPEDLTNEADAAAAEVGEVKRQFKVEGARAKSKHQAAAKTHATAAAKRALLVEDLNRKEAEINRLQAEQVRLKAETERMGVESVTMKNDILERQGRVEKLKVETVAIEALHAEKVKEFQRVQMERDKSIIQLNDSEAAHRMAVQALEQLKEQERTIALEAERSRAENERQKARVDGQTAELNMQMVETQARIDNSSLINSPNSKPIAGEQRRPANFGLTLKKTCRIFDGPVKGASVVGLQDRGTSVLTVKEGKGWYAFNMGGGRNGYLAKSCFSGS